MNMTFQKLKRAATKLGLEVEDDKAARTIYLNAPDGYWIEGDRPYNCYPYDNGFGYDPEWRRDSMQAAYDELEYVAGSLEKSVDS